MQYVFGYLFLFMIGSVAGWCLELVYRRFVSSKKWINPGFLNGPYLPLYGFGVCLLYAICSIPMPLWAQIITLVVMMTVIEYLAGLIFIKGMHIKLWDYSKEWGNIQGIICPLYSLFWGLLGVAFLFFLYPPFTKAVEWVNATPQFLFVVGLFYGIVFVDTAVSFNFALHLKRILSDLKEIVRYEDLKRRIRADAKAEKRRSSFFFPFKSSKPLRTTLREMFAEKASAFKSRRRAEDQSTENEVQDCAHDEKTDADETP